MRYLVILLLAGCTATNWTKQGATTADMDRDYEDCRQIAKPDPAVAAAFGAFGAIGVFAGTRTTDSKIRACMQARGWADPEAGKDAQATASSTSPAPAPMPAEPVKVMDTESPAAKRLRELKSLLDQGLITKQEYEEKRQAVLRGL